MPVGNIPKHQVAVMRNEKFLSEIPHLSFVEARRIKGPLYSALIAELFEEGCIIAAKHFICLVKKEHSLFEIKNLNHRVLEEDDLLLALFENAKVAEKSSKLPDGMGMPATLKILYETLVVLEPYRSKFLWLEEDIYRIIVRIAERYDPEDTLCNEIKSKIFYMFAMFLSVRHQHHERCCLYFEKALQLCRGQNWNSHDIPGPTDYVCFHTFVALKYVKNLIKYSQMFSLNQVQMAIDYAHKAVMTIAELNGYEFRVLFCKALLLKIKFLIEAYRHKDAMDCIKIAEKRINKDLGSEYAPLTCELFLFKGQCYYHFHESSKAMQKFKQSLLLSRNYELRRIEGHALFQMGILYKNFPGSKMKAREAFEGAKAIFTELKDAHNLKLTRYALAHMFSTDHFSELVRLIKKSVSFCDLFKLRMWKDRCQPYWNIMDQQNLDHVDTENSSDISLNLSVGSSMENTDSSASESSWNTNAGSSITLSPDETIFGVPTTKTKLDRIHCLLQQKEVATEAERLSVS